MKRRTFLASMMSVAALSVPVISCQDRNTALHQALSLPQVLSRLTDEETIRQIGKAYRDRTPAESDRDTLTDRLMEGSATPSGPPSSEADLHPLLEQKIRQDFEMGRMAILRGWVLSLTEARQCALYSLTQS